MSKVPFLPSIAIRRRLSNNNNNKNRLDLPAVLDVLGNKIKYLKAVQILLVTNNLNLFTSRVNTANVGEYSFMFSSVIWI